MKRYLLIILIVLSPLAAFADSILEQPQWSVEVKAGSFVPDIDNFSSTYGDRSVTDFEATAAYKIIRQIEVGVGGGYSRAGGSGYAPLHQQNTGHVILNLYPVDVFVLARGIFNEDQLVVPYIGGGWSRVYYREEVEGQSTARGFADGYHARAGLQFLLDVVDPSAANGFFRDVGVHHTWLFFEGKYSRAMADTIPTGPSAATQVNLGGKSLMGGLLFEF